jgi:YHS domain-containing protein
MKNLLVMLVLSGSAAWLATTATVLTPARAAEPATQPTTAPSKPINKECPVMPGDEIDPEVTVVYQGKTIAFCCPACVKKFNKDPEKYLKNLK